MPTFESVWEAVSQTCPRTFVSRGMSVCPTLSMTAGRFSATRSNIVRTLGTALSAKVPIASSSCCVSWPTSASSAAIPTSQFSHAALAAAADPWIVFAASSCVVPTIPSCSCMSWMALIWSANESITRSPARPWALSYSLASSMRRAISSLVPPYPSLRLSNRYTLGFPIF